MIEWNPNFPVIDLESYYKDLRKAFPEKYEIRILHGKMKAAEKEQIMQEFQENQSTNFTFYYCRRSWGECPKCYRYAD